MSTFILRIIIFALLFSPSTAFAELNFGGDASVRLQEWITGIESKDAVDWQYRLNLRASADLGDGYFFKTLLTNLSTLNAGWQTVGNGKSETYNLQFAQCYFGRNISSGHYSIGLLPTTSPNNPIGDLTLFPTQPLNAPLALTNALFGAHYDHTLGTGHLGVSFIVLDDNSAGNTGASGDGLWNDGYAISLSYKFNIGSVTFDPQFLTALTKADVFSGTQAAAGNTGTIIHYGFRPISYGTNIALPPAAGIRFSTSAFFTRGTGTTPEGAPTTILLNGKLINLSAMYGGNVDYFGNLFRIKAESGPFMVWYDHNSTTDNSTGTRYLYTNNFVFAQYKINLYQSAKGSFTLQPTLRYLSSKESIAGASQGDNTLLLPELWATMTF